jgi:hypothetical protein
MLDGFAPQTARLTSTHASDVGNSNTAIGE